MEAIEKNIISLIRRNGGRVMLSTLVPSYKKAFKEPLPVPPKPKLSKWVLQQFRGVALKTSQKNNKFVVEKVHGKKQAQISCNKNDRNNADSNVNVNINAEEGHIVALLQQNNNRIKLNGVGIKYRCMFNKEMPIPEGMKLWEWFAKFKWVDVEFNLENNQSYLVLLQSLDGSILAKEEEKHIKCILEHNDGYIEMNEMVNIFKKFHKRDIIIAQNAGSGRKVKLAEWLCSLDSIVLARKPLCNQIFVALKHSLQCIYEKANAQTNDSKATATIPATTKRKRIVEETPGLPNDVPAKKANLCTPSPNSDNTQPEVTIKSELSM